ncbi:prevent-host-death protein [Rhizobiaceae bacterium CRRU44]|uniref:Prevent-host-death protein n=1 Tax=Ferranicluibacter rubi TaxID=2715133 RepID=A0AA44CB16_9HYPH|nr:prevent-host-death protein [Ferranicluibacter rubi]NHT76324.1 prevent-host-death protein [Ferranicluibacter rubi]
MSVRHVGAVEFEATCMTIIDRMKDDGEPVIVIKGGEPVAMVTPLFQSKRRSSVIGALKAPDYDFDDPFGSIAAPGDWNAQS